MILLLIALLGITVIGLYLSHEYNLGDGLEAFAELIGWLCTLIGILGLIFYITLVFGYVAAGHKTRLLNKEYGTNYSVEEVFYAEGMIETVRELHRTRIEVKGKITNDK